MEVICSRRDTGSPFGDRRGFTLLEAMILAVAVVIGISLVVPGLQAARMTANERDCRMFLRQLGQAEEEAARDGVFDRNQDATGEFGFLEELLQSERFGGEDIVFKDRGVFARHGYLFRIVLPDAQNMPVQVREAERVDPESAESEWLVLAWPETYGWSGIRCFALNQRLMLVQTDNVLRTYSGMERAPHPLAPFLDDRSGMAGELVTFGGQGYDGQLWFRATE